MAGDAAPLTAAFHGLPTAHDVSTRFGFQIRFSEEFEGLKLTAFENGALEIANGRLVDVKRATPLNNCVVKVRVRPDSDEAVTLTLKATTDCTAAGAICASDGRKLSAAVEASVAGPGVKPGTTPPKPASAEVDGRIASVTFDEDLAPVASTKWFNLQWTVTGTGVRHHPNRAWFTGTRTVEMELAPDYPARAGQTVTLAYEASDFLKDAAGNQVEHFSIEATNRTGAPPNTAATGRRRSRAPRRWAKR